jgi:hypothetical protein
MVAIVMTTISSLDADLTYRRQNSEPATLSSCCERSVQAKAGTESIP